MGYEVYRCFQLTVPSDPEADLHECLGLVGHYYGYVPAGRPSPQSSSSRGTDVRFFTPNGNIACEMFDNGASQGTVGCIMNSPPAIARLAANGLVSICQHQGLSCTGNLGDGPGIPDGKLPYGTSKTVGRFRCTSASSGVTCIVTATGKGFFISKQSVRAVG